jgi:hypothetical protein
MNAATPISPAPAVLGVAGLLPFITLAALAALGPVTWYVYSLTALSQYGAVILAFVGALHWGYALQRGARGQTAWLQYGFSVVPALLGWASLFFDVWTALRMQAVALLGCYAFDLAMARLDPVPAAFLRMRAVLTVIGTASLLLASLI